MAMQKVSIAAAMQKKILIFNRALNIADLQAHENCLSTSAVYSITNVQSISLESKEL